MAAAGVLLHVGRNGLWRPTALRELDMDLVAPPLLSVEPHAGSPRRTPRASPSRLPTPLRPPAPPRRRRGFPPVEDSVPPAPPSTCAKLRVLATEVAIWVLYATEVALCPRH